MIFFDFLRNTLCQLKWINTCRNRIWVNWRPLKFKTEITYRPVVLKHTRSFQLPCSTQSAVVLCLFYLFRQSWNIYHQAVVIKFWIGNLNSNYNGCVRFFENEIFNDYKVKLVDQSEQLHEIYQVQRWNLRAVNNLSENVIFTVVWLTRLLQTDAKEFYLGAKFNCEVLIPLHYPFKCSILLELLKVTLIILM